MNRVWKIAVVGVLLLVGMGLTAWLWTGPGVQNGEQRTEHLSSHDRDNGSLRTIKTATQTDGQLSIGPSAHPPGLPAVEHYTESRIRAIIGALPPDFHLSQAEVEQLVSEYLTLQSVRNAHEMSIAEVKLTGGVLDVSIPNYAGTGAEIRSMLQERFSRILGPERGSEAWRRLQNDITTEFDMFGDSTQDLLATVVRSDSHEIIRIERTTNWLGSDTSHFSTSVYLFDVRQIERSDYVYMAPLLRRLVGPKNG